MRILVVEDDAVLRDGIVRLLNAQGYAVECAGGGGEALDLAALTRPDLIVLDLSLPDLDGLDVLRALRNGRDRTPVLILSARSELPSRVAGLDLGADDFLAKPFATEELVARCRALIRRAHGGGDTVLVNGQLAYDLATGSVTLGDAPLMLRRREREVLEALMRRAGKVVAKEQLVGLLSGGADDPAGPNAVEIHVGRLRRRLEPAGFVIRTVRGLGYLMDRA